MFTATMQHTFIIVFSFSLIPFFFSFFSFSPSCHLHVTFLSSPPPFLFFLSLFFFLSYIVSSSFYPFLHLIISSFAHFTAPPPLFHPVPFHIAASTSLTEGFVEISVIFWLWYFSISIVCVLYLLYLLYLLYSYF